VGRPRATTGGNASVPPRDEILDAAAALFVENGFAATTTRAIAERTGIRQASLYYHFAGKDDILAELLERTVRPSLEFARTLREESLDPATALHRLAVRDVQTLASAPHNVGTLYLLPEANRDRFDDFRASRRELRDAYGALATDAATDAIRATWTTSELGAAIIHLVEIVIPLRRDGEAIDASHVADACLRVCGLDDAAIDAARRPATAH
jgi:AcrR family transcriptional regulator